MLSNSRSVLGGAAVTPRIGVRRGLDGQYGAAVADRGDGRLGESPQLGPVQTPLERDGSVAFGDEAHDLDVLAGIQRPVLELEGGDSWRNCVKDENASGSEIAAKTVPQETNAQPNLFV